MDAHAYLPNENLSNDKLEDDNASVSSFKSTKRPLKRRNKVLPEEKQIDNEPTKSLKLYMNEKMKKWKILKTSLGNSRKWIAADNKQTKS